MVICHKCGKNILYSKKILDNGVKHICATEYDITKCKKTQQENIRKAQIKHNLEQVLQQCQNNDVYIIKCNCGKYFYTIYEIKTSPPQTQCPYCNVYHSK